MAAAFEATAALSSAASLSRAAFSFSPARLRSRVVCAAPASVVFFFAFFFGPVLREARPLCMACSLVAARARSALSSATAKSLGLEEGAEAEDDGSCAVAAAAVGLSVLAAWAGASPEDVGGAAEASEEAMAAVLCGTAGGPRRSGGSGGGGSREGQGCPWC